MTVAHLIESRPEVFSISDQTTVYEVARYLQEKEVRAVGVLGAQGRLVSVISQSDISDKVAAENKCQAWMHVSGIVSTRPIVVNRATALDECLRLMEKHKMFHLTVAQDETRLLGLISVQDLLRVIASDQKARADLLEAYIFPKRREHIGLPVRTGMLGNAYLCAQASCRFALCPLPRVLMWYTFPR